ncbi:MAG: hypothetical protein DRP35_07910 [Candidatus Zixiibacteriota bacterium]|nr:MAG: hypothetical protein DRP35_07910 [candidate division Zixibacteria bacterium]
MNDNQIDSFFKANTLQNIDSWNKDNAWYNLNKKRKTIFLKRVTIFSIVFLILIAIPFFFIFEENQESRIELTEYQKRQELLLIEEKLSESHGKTFTCENCYR